MKKLLLASSALVAFAGAAAADITLKGDARMGLVYDGAASATNFTSRARVQFNLSGETDTGLAFGAKFRAHEADAARRGGAGEVFISGAFGKLSLGDVDGAFENAVGDLYGVGLTGIGDHNETVYITNNVQNNDPALLYEYSTGGLSFYLGAMDGDADTANDQFNGASVDVDTMWSIGAAYSMGDFSFGIGYEDNGTASHIGLSAEGKFSNVSVKAIYATADDLDFDQYGISAKANFGATTVIGYYRIEDFTGVESSYIGIGAEYSLGGGATLVGGIASVDRDAVNVAGAAAYDDVKADFGIKFTF